MLLGANLSMATSKVDKLALRSRAVLLKSATSTGDFRQAWTCHISQYTASFSDEAPL